MFSEKNSFILYVVILIVEYETIFKWQKYYDTGIIFFLGVFYEK